MSDETLPKIVYGVRSVRKGEGAGVELVEYKLRRVRKQSAVYEGGGASVTTRRYSFRVSSGLAAWEQGNDTGLRATPVEAVDSYMELQSRRLESAMVRKFEAERNMADAQATYDAAAALMRETM